MVHVQDQLDGFGVESHQPRDMLRRIVEDVVAIQEAGVVVRDQGRLLLEAARPRVVRLPVWALVTSRTKLVVGGDWLSPWLRLAGYAWLRDRPFLY